MVLKEQNPPPPYQIKPKWYKNSCDKINRKGKLEY